MIKALFKTLSILLFKVKTEHIQYFSLFKKVILLIKCFSNILSDFVLAAEKTNDKEISVIRDALQLSEHALIFDKMLLVPQLLDRLSEEKVGCTKTKSLYKIYEI